MPARTFAYTALDTAGTRRTGKVEAEDQAAAIARLTAEGRFVLEIKPTEHGELKSAKSGGSHRKPSRQDLALFTRRIADLSGAGLPLDRVLYVVAEQSESATLKHVTLEVLEDVRSGLPVSQALAKHPKFFSDVFTQTLRAGEASGQFPQVAVRLAELQETEVARRSAVVNALVYPSILAFTALMVITFLMTFVVPRLSNVFRDLGSNLPISTRILLSSADFLAADWPFVIGGLVVAVFGIKSYMATPAGKYAKDRFMMRAPILGPVIVKSTISRFTRILGTLIYGGVPILEGLDIAGHATGNKVFVDSAAKVADDVRDGRPIANAMSDAGEFPLVLVHMVAIGEETGELSQMLGRVADSLDFEVDTGMRRLVSLVEPLVVLFMGTFVGFVVVSVLLPIFEAQDLIK